MVKMLWAHKVQLNLIIFYHNTWKVSFQKQVNMNIELHDMLALVLYCGLLFTMVLQRITLQDYWQLWYKLEST